MMISYFIISNSDQCKYGVCLVNASVSLVATISSKCSTLRGIPQQPRGQTGNVNGEQFQGNCKEAHM